MPGDFRYVVVDQYGQQLEEGTGKDEVVLGDALPTSHYVVRVTTGSTSKAIQIVKP